MQKKLQESGIQKITIRVIRVMSLNSKLMMIIYLLFLFKLLVLLTIKSSGYLRKNLIILITISLGKSK